MSRIYSAIKASGVPTLGNYLGAMRNWVKLQERNECICAVADLHSLTVRQAPEDLNKNTRNMFILLLAIGLGAEESTIYIQSQVPQHSELGWILNCYTYTGELNRMTQYKDKSQRHSDNINGGLYTYPTLMAADILLYETEYVPTGADQKQHVELCRDIAERFNKIYGETFTVPEPLIMGSSSKITNLKYPEKKMSKSEDASEEDGVIFLFDEEKAIREKIKRAVTDSDNKVYKSETKPGISNLLNIYSSIKGIEVEEAEKIFRDSNYGEFKTAVAEAVIELIKPIQERYKELSSDPEKIEKLIKIGREKAIEMAEKKLKEVKERLGLLI